MLGRSRGRMLSNTGLLLFERALRLMASVFVGLWVARHLGPEQYGKLSYVTSFVALLAGVAGLGLDALLVRVLVERPDEAERVLGSAFVLRIAAALTTFLAIGSLAWLTQLPQMQGQIFPPGRSPAWQIMRVQPAPQFTQVRVIGGQGGLGKAAFHTAIGQKALHTICKASTFAT